MMKSPIIVIGSPRSGTSFVARCLVERYGVRMAFQDYRSLKSLPDYQTYEDEYVVNLNAGLGKEKLSFRQYKKQMKWWFRKMDKKSGLWGFKDPRLFKGLRWIIEYHKGDLTIVRTIRRAELVIKSTMKNLGWTREQAVQVINGYEAEYSKALAYKDLAAINLFFDGSIKTDDDFVRVFDKALAGKHAIEGGTNDFNRIAVA